MKPQQIKKQYFQACQNNRQKCLFCNNTYKENVTRMAIHISKCPKVPESIKNIVSKNKVGTYVI